MKVGKDEEKKKLDILKPRLHSRDIFVKGKNAVKYSDTLL